MTCYTADEIAIGTPHYQAPEDKALMDERSDLFALARTLFAVLTETQPPKVGRLSLRNPKFPRSLDQILGKASHREPDARYDSVEAFSEDLKRVMAGERVATTQPRPWLPWAGLTCLLIAMLGWYWASTNQAAISEPAPLTEPRKLFSSGAPYKLSLIHI